MFYQKCLSLALLCILSCPLAILADVEIVEPNIIKSEKSIDIKRLIKLTDLFKIGSKIKSNVIANYQKSFPQIPPKFWNELSADINPEEMIELLVPVYDKLFIHHEIKQLISFYESPLGQKVTYTTPNIMKESFYVGVQWIRKFSEHIIMKLENAGYIDNNNAQNLGNSNSNNTL